MRKYFVGESFTVALIRVPKNSEKRGEGVSRFSVKNVLLRVPKNSVGESVTVALFSGSEKVRIGVGGSIKVFRQKFYVSQCRKIS